MIEKFSLETFETDFWKGADQRAGWDDIEVGATRVTRPVTITKEMIQRFARSFGDDNPLYYDEAYAKTTRFGGIISPPTIHILLMMACTPHTDFMRTPGTVNAGQNWTYHRPVRPGDTITLECRALDKLIRKGRLFIVHDNVFKNQRGEVVCAGRGWTIRPS